MESIVKMGVKSSQDKGKGKKADVSGMAAGGHKEAAAIPGTDRIVGMPAEAGGGRAEKKDAAAERKAPSAALKETGGQGKADGRGGQAAAAGAPGMKKLPDGERALMQSRRRHYRVIMEYVVATVLICLLLFHLTNRLGYVLRVLGNAVRIVWMLLTPLFWGFIVAYILAPLADFFEDRFRASGRFYKNPSRRRGAAVAVTFILAFLFLAVLFSVVASAVTRSLRLASLEDLVIMIESLGKTLKSFQRTIQDWLLKMNLSSNEVAAALSEVGEQAARFTSGLSSTVTGTITQIGGILTRSIFVIIFSVYFLLDSKGLKRYWNRVILALGGKKARRGCHLLACDADAVFSGYIRGQLIDAFIMAFLVSAALYLIGVKYAVIIGILSGLGNLIPYLGPVVAYGSTVVVCLLSGDLKRMIVALVVLFVIQTVDGNVINPHLLSASIDVHPMLVIAALIIGGSISGLVGMLFAVPVAAFLKIQFDKIIHRLLLIRVPEARRARAGTGAPHKRKKKKRASGAGK